MNFKSISNTAWREVRGVKKLYWLAALWVFLLNMGYSIIQIPIQVAMLHSPAQAGISGVFSVLRLVLVTPAGVGLLLLMRRHHQQLNVRAGQLFDVYRWRKIATYVVLMLLTIIIGGLLVLLQLLMYTHIRDFPGHMPWYQDIGLGLVLLIAAYLSISLFFTITFGSLSALDNAQNPLRLFGDYFMKSTRHFWPLLGFFLYSFVINIISALTIFILSIWTAPYISLMMVQYYQRFYATENTAEKTT